MDIYKALKDVMFDIECMVERGQIPNILDDVVYVRAYEALAALQSDDACAQCGKTHREHVIINLGHVFQVPHRN